jgi:hypothetical protein
MNIEQAERVLKKINLLFETMTLDDKVNVFERDLMLSYIRQLEEAFSPAEATEKASRPDAPAAPKKPEPKADIKTALKAAAEKASQLSSLIKSRQRRNWSFPSITTPASSVKKTVPKKAPKAVPKEPPKAVAGKSKPSAAKAAPPRAKVEKNSPPKPRAKAPVPTSPAFTKQKWSSKSVSKSEHDALFDFKDAEELLKIRSQMHIKDLTKAMSSRERNATIKELFDDNSGAFDAALRTLNTFKSYSQAKGYLIDNVVDKYGWLDKSKKDKTSDFIKLVRRRYN